MTKISCFAAPGFPAALSAELPTGNGLTVGTVPAGVARYGTAVALGTAHLGTAVLPASAVVVRPRRAPFAGVTQATTDIPVNKQSYVSVSERQP